jgi:hypothetical protein
MVISIAIVLPSRRQLSCHHCCPMQSAAAVTVSLCDTCHCPSPPLLPITIMPPSCCPWRCCRCSPLQLRCYCATLRHILKHCPPSTCRLVVTSGWLSSRHLSSRHRLSGRRLVVHVTSQCTTLLFAPAGCCVTSPPLPPLNVPACCHLASHHATLLFALPGCPVTPCRATTSIKFGFDSPYPPSPYPPSPPSPYLHPSPSERWPTVCCRG